MSQKILIVDDQKNVLRMVGYLLEREGYKTSVAITGTQALEKIGTEKPDLVILDVMMPDMSGFEVCQKIREDPETLRLPIILFSALSETYSKVQGLKAGADEYLTKLIEPSEFIARVEALLQRSQSYASANKPKKGAVWGVMGAKGGVGTTTVVLNLATVLASQEKKVAAVEMRSDFGTFSAQLNLGFSEPVAGIVHLLRLGSDKISEQHVGAYLIKHHSGLKILVGPQKVDEFQEIEPQQAESIIDKLASMEDFVFLDLSCHPSQANRAAIERCNMLVLTVEAEPASVASARVALSLLKSWGIARNIIKLVVVNRSQLANPIKISEIESQLECEILGVIPPASDNLIAAQRLGVPVVLAQSEGDAARAFLDIAKNIITIV